VSAPLIAVEVRRETDVVLARQRARQVAALLGFDGQDQVRIATAVSELARNVVQYAGEGRVEFAVELASPPACLRIRVSDRGPGVRDLQDVLSGRYRSTTGMGLGIVGARRLMDRFGIESAPDRGTSITLEKLLPPGAPDLDPRGIGRIAEALAREAPANALTEVQQQNQELVRTLEELRRRQEELFRLNEELQDTNRGVVALYAELDDRAESLKRADALKSKFLSHVSHEFRTPLNSILAISRMLEERADGDLTPEQAKQVAFIRKAALDLTELVNDLLDLAKVEAGRTDVRPKDLDVRELFAALRGVLRPLATNPAVALELEDPPASFRMYTDEGKVAQILRNLVSNALKFTEQGEVRLRVEPALSGRGIAFVVTDTGIGIAPQDHERVFQEFGQVEGPLQGRVKGTGLGLPLSRKLAELLGGSLVLHSALGEGSTFRVTLPLVYRRREESVEGAAGLVPAAAPLASERRGGGARVLIVDDDPAARDRLRRTLEALGHEVVEAPLAEEGLRRARLERPDAVFLDLVLPDGSGFEILDVMQSDPGTSAIPIIVVSSKPLTEAEAKRLEAPGTAFVPKDAWASGDPQATVRDALLRAGWGARLLGDSR
jgi:signal transduction histidine kinase/CheY-like chemotaxis protein